MARAMRTSVSVPPELKARMDAVDVAINWSAVACQAFEQKLLEVTSRKGIKDMKDVVNRLRASKQRKEEGRFQEGYAAGESWAKESAEVEELERLHSVWQGTRFREYEWELMWASNENNAY